MDRAESESASVVATHSGQLAFPLDILLLIVQDLDIQDILTVGQCCKHLYFLTNARSLWHAILQTRIIDNYIPIPPLSSSESLLSLSTNQLKRIVCDALTLRDSWTSPHPIPTRTLSLPRPRPDVTPSTVKVVPGRGNRYVIMSTTLTTLQADIGLSNECRHWLRCLDVGAPNILDDDAMAGLEESRTGTCVATRVILRPPVFTINEDRETEALVACASSQDGILTTLILALDTMQPESDAFVGLTEFPTQGDPLLLSGHILATGDKVGNVWLYDTRTGGVIYELQDPQVPQMNETVRVVSLSDLILTFGNASIKIFTLPIPIADFPPSTSALQAVSSVNSLAHASLDHNNTTIPTHSVLLPTTTHRWRWRLDTICVSPLVSSFPPTSTSSSRHLPVINILVRFGSWYPWPLNMLHHYTLSPYPSPPSLDSSASEGPQKAHPNPFETRTAPQSTSAPGAPVSSSLPSAQMDRMGPVFTTSTVDNSTVALTIDMDNFRQDVHDVLTRYGRAMAAVSGSTSNSGSSPSPSSSPSNPASRTDSGSNNKSPSGPSTASITPSSLLIPAATANVALPYSEAPVLNHYTSSTLDLFAVSDTLVGEYGTALWLDSQMESTVGEEYLFNPANNGAGARGGGGGGGGGYGESDFEDGVGQGVTPNPAIGHGGFGGGHIPQVNQAGSQRVAGKVLPRPFAPSASSISISASASAASSSTAAEERYVSYDGRAQRQGGWKGRARGTTVFGLHERSEVYLLGMDEEIGRVVVAWKDGGLGVYDYMPGI